MKQLIQLIAVLAMSAWQIQAQTVEIDRIDWSTQAPGSTSGLSNEGTDWASFGFDQDGSGTFGVSSGVFVFEDTEGSEQCPCVVGDPNPACGNNDNFLGAGFLLQNYCEATISFEITTRGTLNCGAQNDQNAPDVQVGVCPSDNGDAWMSTDALEVKLASTETGEERVLKICGATAENGSFTIDETFDIGELGTSLAVIITGGTQSGGSYDIGNIVLTGIPRLNTTLNTQITTSHDNNVVCEGIGTIIVQTAADPLSQFTWALPDGSTLSGNRNNGRDVLTLTSIQPSMSGIYRVTVVDDNLCELYDELDITILASNDAACLDNVSFDLFSILCSTDTLPSADLNGITGTWTPGAILADYAGQTINFTFTPDDPAVAPDLRLITVDDLSDFENFASQPTEIPLLCNAADTTYDFIEMFDLNYTDFRLEISGDKDLFNFIPNNSIAVVDAFIDEFRNIDVFRSKPKERIGFQVEAYAACGAPPIRKSFFVTIIDPADPIKIDTTLCEGDYIDYQGYKIFRDTTIFGAGACDTMFDAKINVVQPTILPNFYDRNLSCGTAVYYYDTIVDGRYIGFIDAPLASPPPFGPAYDTVFTTSYQGNFLLPGSKDEESCGIIQKLRIGIGFTDLTPIEFDLCSNLDTTIRVGAASFILDAETPYYYVPTGPCRATEIRANILPALVDSLPHQTFCASEVASIEVAPGDFRDFDASMTYPRTVFLDAGANGCAATVIVDLDFILPTRDTIVRRLCPDESFTVGTVTFDSDVVEQEVLLSGAAASGCDSIVTVSVSVLQPVNIPVIETICAEDNLDVEGTTFDINQPTGSVSVPSVLGCDSLIYDVTLDFFIVNDTIIDPEICPGDEIFLAEYNYTIDIDNLTADLVGTTADGCDQNVLIRASIDDAIQTSFSETICGGDSYMFDGIDRTTSGSYTETHIAASGCDSISTLNLTVSDVIPVTDDGILTECTGVPVSHLGKIYDEPGIYEDTLQSFMGCDSIITFTISFDPIPVEYIGVQMTCPDTPIEILGVTYDAEGSYQDTIQTSGGCDSIVSFDVSFFQVVTSDAGVFMTCPDVPFEYLGNQYTVEGPYSETLTSDDGCDSIVTFEVAFFAVETTDIGVMYTCPDEPLEFMGIRYRDEGSYEAITTSSNGCDSILAFTIAFYEIETTDIGVMYTCPDERLEFMGIIYQAEGSYEAVTTSSDGCDSVLSFTIAFHEIETTDIGVMYTCPDEPLEFMGIMYQDEGSYEAITTSADGCDSILAFTLSYHEIVTTDLGILMTCPDQPVVVEGASFPNEGSFSTMTTSSEGCDSILTFQVMYHEIPTTDIGVITTCPEVPVTFLGQSYPNEGNFTVELQSSNGCDSLVQFEVAFELPEMPTVEVTICAGEQFMVFNNEFATNTDEVVTLVGGGQNGCDTSVHLLLTVLEDIETNESFEICNGHSVVVGNRTFSTAVENEPVVFQSQDMCDSIVFVTVDVLPLITFDLGEVQICGTGDYVHGDTTLTTDGIHVLTYQAENGCDSLVTLEIVRVQEFEVEMETTLCEGETMEMNGKSYSLAGTYRDTLTTDQGCDSILVINVTILDKIDTTWLSTEVLCDGAAFSFNGEEYTATGQYPVDLLSSKGCDSTVVLTIEQYEAVTTTIVAETCSNIPYVFEGESYTSSGIYPLVHQAASGCDSTVMLELTVIESYDVDLGIRQICTGSAYQVGSHVLTEEDTYTLTLTSQTGCDSVVQVTIDVVDEIMVDLGTVTICEGASYVFADQTITISGDYTVTDQSSIGCDSITSINVQVTPLLEIDINELIGSCEGGANGSFVIDDIPGALPPFTITGIDGISQIPSLPFTVSGLAEGDYSIDISDANGCMTMADITITNDRENALTITSITVDPTGLYELILEYSGEIATIEWEDIEGLSCYDCPNPSVDIEETTTFRVTVVDVEGCVSTAEITLGVDGIGNIYFPNVINPNSALGNHKFFPQTELGSDAHFDLFIFDRWGNMVYEMLGGPINDISFGWNGRYSDNRINAGVFVYSVRVYKENGITQTYKGDVTVVE